MNSTLLCCEADISLIRRYLEELSGETNVGDIEEALLIPTVRERMRIWQRDGRLIGFAYVDNYHNLWFETESDDVLEDEVIAWGETCIRNMQDGSNLDFCCRAGQDRLIGIVQKHGFVEQTIRSLKYARSLDTPIENYDLPKGFFIRCVFGEEEVTNLVQLHQAAFGTENMTIDERLAMMRTPGYARELDLLAIDPQGEPAGFCVCSIDIENPTIGSTDPIGIHPRWQGKGVGKALTTFGLRMLKQRGVHTVELGTSSENTAMQKLAEALGFTCTAENIWFSKEVSMA